MELFKDVSKGAYISDCKNYRYALYRIWDDTKPYVFFIMLNPSTADDVETDSTITRLAGKNGFARAWGYGGIYVGNLFAFRTKKPELLLKAEHPISEPEKIAFNDSSLVYMKAKCEKTIFAWGNDGKYLNRCNEVAAMFPNSYCFGKTLLGQPLHPLYLKSDLKPIPF